jgi:hypothetical protein
MGFKFVKVQEEHLEKIRLWRMSEEVTMYLYTDPQINQEGQKKWYQQIIQDPFRMDWVVNVDGMDVGVVWLYDINPLHRRCFWAYYLAGESVRGKGIGGLIELNLLNYVFEHFKLHKLCCEVFEWNHAVVKIHQKCGFKIEGVFREHIWKRGKYHNVVSMGILRQDWEQEVKAKFAYHPVAEIEEWKDKKDYIATSLMN